MLDAFKKLISRPPPGPEWREVSEWAKRNKLAFKRESEGTGFALVGGMESKPWRLEWGPPQRNYIEGNELRLRMELGLSPNLQMLLISQPLLETLERQTFERFTESTQTVIDSNTPEEMRWLAMFSKVPYKASKEVRMRFALVGNVSAEAESWVEGALAHQMEEAAAGFLKGEPPFVLMLLRGRAYLRMQMPEPDVAHIGQSIGVFETAVLQALRVAGLGAEKGSDWSSTGSTAWQTQLGLEDDPKRR
ncbi:MAG TPA: hypothetical protein VFL64_11895 [Rhizobacter sp.]|nr:hypothetical protein [Rhizobacter sp.]